MKIKLKDGKIIEEEDIKNIIYNLKMNDATEPLSIQEYMETVKKRFEALNKDINTNSIEDFFYSLEEVDLIEIIDENSLTAVEKDVKI